MKIVGISRGSKYSPNHIGNDAAIFNKVMDELRLAGNEVETYSENEFLQTDKICADVIVSMARDAQTLFRLREMEIGGFFVLNSPVGIENCIRLPMTERLLESGVPHPKSWILQTTGRIDTSHLCYPCWIKRGESHALQKEDVCYVSTPIEASSVLAEFCTRSIPVAVVNEHIQGDLVKFYGVQDSNFFHWFYPSLASHSKFGLEKINGDSKGFQFDVEHLKSIANQAAMVLNVPIYGGDAVILSDGSIKLIDFNDWPSFAPCREEAAKAIAWYVMKCFEHRKNN